MATKKSSATEKLLPRVYDDAVSPAAKEVGKTLAKAVRTSLRPVNGVIWTFDQAFDWVSERVSAFLAHEGVKSRRVTPPPIEIEGRVLAGLQIAGPADDVLRNMFAALIGNAMNSDASDRVHPAFVEMLRQITPVEARLLAVLCHAGHPSIVEGDASAKWQIETTYPGGTRSWASVGKSPQIHNEWPKLWERMGLPVSDRTEVSDALSNLARLGIVTQRRINSLDTFDSDELHDPWFYSVTDWIRKLNDFIKAGPGQPMPSPQNDLGIETFEVGDGGFMRAKRRSDTKFESMDFKVSNTVDLLIVDMTYWGKRLGTSCQASAFVHDGAVVLPAWAR